MGRTVGLIRHRPSAGHLEREREKEREQQEKDWILHRPTRDHRSASCVSGERLGIRPFYRARAPAQPEPVELAVVTIAYR